VKRRGFLALVVVAAIAAAVASWRRRGEDFVLPSRITVDEVVADLSATFDRAAVVEEAAAAPVRVGELEPGDALRGFGPRTSLIASPRSRLRFRVEVPAGAVLRFGVGVDGPKQRDSGRSGVRFSVAVDGGEIYARSVNPALRRSDRRWFDERIELGKQGNRSVEIVLATDAERDDRPLAGTPGWSDVRLVRETIHERQPAGPAAPNVLVLLVDTLRADGLGCYGAVPSPTPNLDRLAAAGQLFEHAIAQSTWTMPSVASLLTGLYPRSHGALGSREAIGGANEGLGEAYLSDTMLTWAEAAARAGITTVGVSSNPLVSRGTNLAQGFETFVEFPWDPAGKNWTPAPEVNRAFLRWLERNRSRRFVGYLHYMEPHDPYTPPTALRPAVPAGVRPAVARGWIRDIANKVNWKGAAPLSPMELAYVRQLYDGEIRAWDAELATLLEGLSRLGVRESTLLVVTADHGEEFQEHAFLTHGSHLYEETMRVPLIIAGPGVHPERRADLAQGIDVFPTLAAFLGLPAPVALAGRDLLATRNGAPVISETARGIAPDGAPMRLISVRTADWKLIHAPDVGRFELYDLAHDPGERENRYGQATEGEDLTRVLARWQATAPPPPKIAAHDPTLRDKLRALGYLE
jgi:arylsulfatase A-like enzyme